MLTKRSLSQTCLPLRKIQPSEPTATLLNGGCQPFLTQKEMFLVAIFFFVLEKHLFVLPVYSFRRQLAMMTGFSSICGVVMAPDVLTLSIWTSSSSSPGSSGFGKARQLLGEILKSQRRGQLIGYWNTWTRNRAQLHSSTLLCAYLIPPLLSSASQMVLLCPFASDVDIALLMGRWRFPLQLAQQPTHSVGGIQGSFLWGKKSTHSFGVYFIITKLS